MIFISYRKDDVQSVVDFLAEKLKRNFGQTAVFKDDRDIRAGESWAERIKEELLASDVLLAVIGDKWLTMLDEHGKRRIDNDKDWVRQEICTALEANKPVIVILVNDAKMPTTEGLPGDCRLQDLPQRQYLRLRSGRDSESDIQQIVVELARVVHQNATKSSHYHVVAFDLDGTLVRGQKPFSWKQIWDFLGYTDNIRKLGAQKYLKGEWTHQEWCTWACKMFRQKGLTRASLCELGKSMRTVANLRETLVGLKEAGLVLGLISGGIDVFLTEAIPDAFELFDHIYINRLQFDTNGIISGVLANSFDFEGKVDALHDICTHSGCSIEQAVFVGEGFNDMAVLRQAGLSIAFSPVSEGIADVAIVLDQWDLALLPPLLTF